MVKYSRKKQYKVETKQMSRIDMRFEFIAADEYIVVLRDREGRLNTYAHEYVSEIPPTPEEIANELLQKQCSGVKASFGAFEQTLRNRGVQIQYVEVKSNVPQDAT